MTKKTKKSATKLVIKPKRVRKVDDHHVIDAEVEIHGAPELPVEAHSNGSPEASLPEAEPEAELPPLVLEITDGPAIVVKEKKGFWARVLGR